MIAGLIVWTIGMVGAVAIGYYFVASTIRTSRARGVISADPWHWLESTTGRSIPRSSDIRVLFVTGSVLNRPATSNCQCVVVATSEVLAVQSFVPWISGGSVVSMGRSDAEYVSCTPSSTVRDRENRFSVRSRPPIELVGMLGQLGWLDLSTDR